jgi:hypothetical protein
VLSRRARAGERSKHGVAAFVVVALLALMGFLVFSFFSRAEPSVRERSAGDGRRAEATAGPPTVTTRRQETSLPTKLQVTRARSFARSRTGVVSFAVVDTSGRVRCFRCRVPYLSASVVKAMLLVAYLNRLAENREPLTASHHALLDAMITVSDNPSATALYGHVGDVGLRRLATRAKMSRFDVFGDWGTARVTAADLALFFSRIDQLTPARYRRYVRQLLSSIVAAQAWGIPEVSRPQWRTFFKGGWRSTSRGSLVHQVARLERGRLSLAIAVLTDGNPDDAYGRVTVRGIAERLLGG